MTIQAFEPSKTNSFHPSIMKGAIAMDADDFKPKQAPSGTARVESEEQEADTLYEQAQAWRDKMTATVQNPEATDWLRNLSREELIEEYQLDREREQQIQACVVSGKFYNPFVYRPALAWRDAQVACIKEKPSPDEESAHADAEKLEWLESLSGDDLLRAHELYLVGEKKALEREVEAWRGAQLAIAGAQEEEWLRALEGERLICAYLAYEKLALYRDAEAWRDDMLSANIPQNDWLKSLAGMDMEQLAKEYQLYVELWGTLEMEGETPETAEEQE